MAAGLLPVHFDQALGRCSGQFGSSPALILVDKLGELLEWGLQQHRKDREEAVLRKEEAAIGRVVEVGLPLALGSDQLLGDETLPAEALPLAPQVPLVELVVAEVATEEVVLPVAAQPPASSTSREQLGRRPLEEGTTTPDPMAMAKLAVLVVRMVMTVVMVAVVAAEMLAVVVKKEVVGIVTKEEEEVVVVLVVRPMVVELESLVKQEAVMGHRKETDSMGQLPSFHWVPQTNPQVISVAEAGHTAYLL